LSFWSKLFRPVEEDVVLFTEVEIPPGGSVTLDVCGMFAVGSELPVKLALLFMGNYYTVSPYDRRRYGIARLLGCACDGGIRLINEDSDYSRRAVVIYTPLRRVYGWSGMKTLYEGYITGGSYVTLNESGVCMLYCNGNESPTVSILSSYGWLPVISPYLDAYLNDYDSVMLLSLAGRVRVGYESGFYGYVKVVKLIL